MHIFLFMVFLILLMVRVIYLSFGATYLVFGGETALDGYLDAVAHAHLYLPAFELLLGYTVGQHIYEGAVAAEFNRAFRQRERLLGTFQYNFRIGGIP